MGRPVEYPCGTTQAYGRHLRHKEAPCQPCKDAAALAKRLKRYKAKAGKPEEPEGLREALRGYSPAPGPVCSQGWLGPEQAIQAPEGASEKRSDRGLTGSTGNT